jgi:hypothetical protein
MLRSVGVTICLIAVSASLGVNTLHAQTQGPSVAYKMAQSDCKCIPSGARITMYKRLLTKLVTHKCKETQLRLYKELVGTQRVLADDGEGHYGLYRLMHLLDGSIPRMGFRQRCLDILAALVVLIEK